MTNKPRILLIDDSQEQLLIIGTLLETNNMAVIKAESAKEGLTKVEQGEVDCIVCDVLMPHMSGQDFVSELRKREHSTSLPVIMLTAATDDMKQELIQAGADLFCEKKDVLKSLINQITLLLEREKD